MIYLPRVSDGAAFRNIILLVVTMMLRAFQFGAPPHGGLAPGIDRIVMLIANEPNIREVTLFPMNQQAQDLLMGAPSKVNPKQLKELFLHIHTPPKETKG